MLRYILVAILLAGAQCWVTNFAYAEEQRNDTNEWDVEDGDEEPGDEDGDGDET